MSSKNKHQFVRIFKNKKKKSHFVCKLLCKFNQFKVMLICKSRSWTNKSVTNLNRFKIHWQYNDKMRCVCLCVAYVRALHKFTLCFLRQIVPTTIFILASRCNQSKPLHTHTHTNGFYELNQKLFEFWLENCSVQLAWYIYNNSWLDDFHHHPPPPSSSIWFSFLSLCIDVNTCHSTPISELYEILIEE